MNYLSGNPHRPKGVRCTSKGLPVCLGPLLKHIVLQDLDFIQILTTVLFSTRALVTKARPDLTPITSPLKKGSVVPEVKYGIYFWKQLGYNPLFELSRKLRFTHFHFSTKSGPNGHALSSWWSDLQSLSLELREAISVMGGAKLRNFISTALTHATVLDGFFKRTPGITRKLAFFPDKEGKTRVIALGDYFSQTVLRRLHFYLFDVLRKIPQDCTFDQGKFKELIKDWKVFYSVDLSSATDRFPIQIISGVLRAHFPAKYVDAWERIMVKEPFRFSGKSVLYSVGNPMGLYSSWSSFTLAHHYLFFEIARELGRPWRTLPYALLGDDVLIGDDEVGKRYMSMVKSLGIEVSELKTHISSTTCEFAKRWIHLGQEISPFPLKPFMLKKFEKSQVFSTLLAERCKGWNRLPVSEMASLVYGIFLNRPSSFKRKVAREGFIFEAVWNITQDTSTASLNFNRIKEELGLSIGTIDQSTALALLSSVCSKLFKESNPVYNKENRGSLGDLAIDLVMYMTSFTGDWVQTLLENPIAHSYGMIEESFIKLHKLGEGLMNTNMFEWPLVLKSMAIPLSDRVFTDRSEKVISRSLSRVVTETEALLRRIPVKGVVLVKKRLNIPVRQR